MNNSCFIVSGTPGSGKSYIGRLLAKELSLPFLDKDDYLEALYDRKGIGDFEWRAKLSLESNALFQMDAEAYDNVVLVSHWRPKDSSGPSGTSTNWLKLAFKSVVEIYCYCPSDIAVQRFLKRVRHEGHLDEIRTADEVFVSIREYSEKLPLKVGKLIEIDTSTAVDISALIESIETTTAFTEALNVRSQLRSLDSEVVDEKNY